MSNKMINSTSQVVTEKQCLVRVQECSAAQSCPVLCKPRACSTLGLSVLHRLLESAQTHVHWDDDAIQSSHPVSPFSYPQSFPATVSFPMNWLFFSPSFSFSAMLCWMWNISSLTKDWTCLPLHWKHGVLTTDLLGKSYNKSHIWQIFLMILYVSFHLKTLVSIIYEDRRLGYSIFKIFKSRAFHIYTNI